MTKDSLYTFLSVLVVVVLGVYTYTDSMFFTLYAIAGMVGLYSCYMIYQIANHLKNILKELHAYRDDKNSQEAKLLRQQLQQD